MANVLDKLLADVIYIIVSVIHYHVLMQTVCVFFLKVYPGTIPSLPVCATGKSSSFLSTLWHLHLCIHLEVALIIIINKWPIRTLNPVWCDSTVNKIPWLIQHWWSPWTPVGSEENSSLREEHSMDSLERRLKRKTIITR